MKTFRHIAALAIALSLTRGLCAQSENPTDTLRTQTLKQLDRFTRDLAKPNPQPEARQFTNAARMLLALDKDATLAQSYIQKAFDLQHMDPAAPDFGTVDWQVGHPEIKDPNSIEFTIHPLCDVFTRYAGKLPPDFKTAAIPHLKAAVAAIRRHKVGLSYTNIYLMKMTNLHLLGQILGDADLKAEGTKGLRDWFDFTRKNGITEFDSPTYANVQLSVLLQAQCLTDDPQLKTELTHALDYFWTDLSANTFLTKPGGAQLAGPFSRTYDFPRGTGSVDNFLFFTKLRTIPLEGTAPTEPLLNQLENGYEPSPAILALAKTPDRLIQQRFGEKPGQDRTCYITDNYAIGSTSAYYLPHDRQLSFSLAADRPLADISVECDQFDNPYGDHKVPDRTGHNKPTHLKNAAAVVQDKATILALWNLAPATLNPQLATSPENTLATNILFPADADEILLDGQPLKLKPNDEIPVPQNSWLIIRQGKAAAALRIFAADSATPTDDADKFSCLIKYDGDRFHTARLVAYHLRANEPTPITTKSLRVGILLLAHDCPTPQDSLTWLDHLHKSVITQSLDNDLWTTTFRTDDSALSATMNLRTLAPVHRLLNGNEVQPHVFSINGIDQTSLLPAPAAIK